MPAAGQTRPILREDIDLTGRELEGRYRIGRKLGKGASGVVYEGRSLAAAIADHGKRQVALKVLSARSVGDADAIARFTHEAFLCSRFSHPGLVKVLDFGWVAPGRPYFAMQLCRGATLDCVLNQAGSLSPRTVVEIVEDAAKALTALHEHGIVHRDVKPSNLFISIGKQRPRARLLDLGVAGVFDARRAKRLGSVDVGATGTYGTPAYIAPEQALGGPTDPRTDVYALACVAYRALTGIEPFRAETIEGTLQAHLFSLANPPSSVNTALPPAVDEVFERAMAKEPGARTPTAARFAAELRIALRSE
jgi:eukaryotic-like serine/threonine-protein kinase